MASMQGVIRAHLIYWKLNRNVSQAKQRRRQSPPKRRDSSLSINCLHSLEHSMRNAFRRRTFKVMQGLRLYSSPHQKEWIANDISRSTSGHGRATVNEWRAGSSSWRILQTTEAIIPMMEILLQMLIEREVQSPERRHFVSTKTVRVKKEVHL